MNLLSQSIQLIFIRNFVKKNCLILLTFFLSFHALIELNAQNTCTSISSGNWNQRSVWSCGQVPTINDNAIITSGTTVTLVNSQSINNLTVAQFGTLDDNNGPTLSVSGDLIVNGSISGTPAITLNGVGKNIDGTGNLSNTSTITIIGNKTIPATAELSFAGNIIISGATTITNNGVITVSGVMNGTTASSTWLNNSNSTLNVGANSILSTGILNASANGNMVNYFSPSSFTINSPLNGTFHHLTISGGGTKTLPNGTIIVNGDLFLNSTLSGNGTAKTLRVRGNWNNNTSTGFTEGAGTVIFDGVNDQFISKSVTENFHNLVISKNSGVLYLNTNIIVGSSAVLTTPSTLTLTSGIVNTGIYSVTIGKGSGLPDNNFIDEVFTGRLVYTSGKIIGRLIRYIYNINVPGTTDSPPGFVLFPIGTTSSYRPIEVKFNNVISGTLAAEFKSDSPGNSGLPLPPENGVTISNTFREGYWTLTSGSGLTSTSYDLSLTADGFGTGQIIINDNTRILTRPNSGQPWTLNGLQQSRNGNTIRRTSINTLSAEYSLGSDNPCTAPVTSAISGSNSVCIGATGIAYSVLNNSNSYTWNVVGGTIASGQNTNAITVNWGNTGLTGTVSVIESNTCTSGPQISLPVEISPFSPVSINGRISVPASGISPINYSITPLPGYTYNWTITGGTPTSATGNSINVTWGAAGTGTVCVTASNACGTSAPPTCVSVNKYTVVRTLQSGNWNNSAVWDCGGCTPQIGDNIMIMNTHTVTINVNGGFSARNVIINPGGTLNTGTTGTNRTLTIDGDLTVDGTLGGVFNVILNASGDNPILDGNGNITNTANLVINRNISITSLSSLRKLTGNVLLGSGVQVTNNGNITLGGSLEAVDNTSVWINRSASTLSVSGVLLANGILIASEPNNTIAYSGAIAQTIKVPQESQYANLLFSGAGIKTAPGSVIRVSGNITNNGTGVSGSNVGFDPNGGTIDFNGISSLTGNSAMNFNNATITGTLTSSAGTVNFFGNLINNGTFNHNDGTVVFNGAVLSSISGTASKTTFFNLTANNSAGLFVEKNVDLINVLNVGAGAFIDVDGVANNREFTLKSSGDNPVIDARIGVLSSATAVRGKLTAERFISNEGRLYRYLSAPVQNSFVSDWMDDFPVTGLFPDKTTSWSGTLCNNVPLATNSASLFYYNEPTPGNFNQGYVAYPLANGGIPATASPLTAGRGYAAFIRVCPNEGLRIDLKGEIYQGTMNLPVSYTAASGATNDGWNLVGNPYLSAIDWDVSGANGWTKTNISNVVAVMDNATGLMRYWDGDDSGSPERSELPGGVISSGQAFWVQAIAASPALTIREGVKVSSNAHQFYRESESTEKVSSAMTIALTNARHSKDLAFVKVRDRVSFERDSWDATKMENGFPGKIEDDLFELATLTPSGLAMAINAIPEIYEGMLIPLQMTGITEGNYNLRLEGTGNFEQYHIELIDNYTGVRKLLFWGDVYPFEVKARELSNNQNRITLQLLKDFSPVSGNPVFDLDVFPNPVKDKLNIELSAYNCIKIVTIFNMVGEKIEELTFDSNQEYGQIDFNSKPTGVYLIRLGSAGYTRWAKVIKN